MSKVHMPTKVWRRSWRGQSCPKFSPVHNLLVSPSGKVWCPFWQNIYSTFLYWPTHVGYILQAWLLSVNSLHWILNSMGTLNWPAIYHCITRTRQSIQKMCAESMNNKIFWQWPWQFLPKSSKAFLLSATDNYFLLPLITIYAHRTWCTDSITT